MMTRRISEVKQNNVAFIRLDRPVKKYESTLREIYCTTRITLCELGYTMRWNLTACFAAAMFSMFTGCTAHPSTSASTTSISRQLLWAAEATGQIRGSFYLPEQRLYGEEIGPGRGRPRPAFVWPSSVMLSALIAAANVDRQTYLPFVREYVDSLRTYRTSRNGKTGLDVWPAPKTPDRYYDDNAWIAVALAEAYDLTRDSRDLEFAAEAIKFTLTGEDNIQGGGIYWHEDRPDRKHTVSSAPTICASMILFRHTKDHFYLDTARRLYAWTLSHLQEPDGLYADSLAASDGKVDNVLYAYNTAMMIRSGCLLYEATQDKQYLVDAERSANAAASKWVRASVGAIQAEAVMAEKLCEALLYLSSVDGDTKWQTMASRAVEYVHDHCRDPNGWYSQRWDDREVAALDPIRLIDQASAARAFWICAK